MQVSAQYRSDLAELVRLAQLDLRVLWRPVSDGVAARALLAETIPELLSVYGSASASMAADWYDDLRLQEAIPGRHRAVVSDLAPRAQTDVVARWAVSPMFAQEPDFAAALQRAEGALQRMIADAGRNTITRSTVADPEARGWQRVGSGECGFCRMLIDRGAVYTEATVDFGAHDHCQCSAVPAWGGRPNPVQPYTGTAREISDADRARTRAWMAQHGY